MSKSFRFFWHLFFSGVFVAPSPPLRHTPPKKLENILKKSKKLQIPHKISFFILIGKKTTNLVRKKKVPKKSKTLWQNAFFQLLYSIFWEGGGKILYRPFCYCYLVDPGSSHTLVLKIKPYISKCFVFLKFDCGQLIITVIELLRILYR